MISLSTANVETRSPQIYISGYYGFARELVKLDSDGTAIVQLPMPQGLCAVGISPLQYRVDCAELELSRMAAQGVWADAKLVKRIARAA